VPSPRAASVLIVLALAGCGGSAATVTTQATGARTTSVAAPPTVTVVVPHPATTPAAQPAATVRPFPREVAVWLPYWNMTAAYASAIANPSMIDVASPFWYSLGSGGSIIADPGAGSPAIAGGLVGERIAVVPTVTETPGTADFVALISDPQRRAAIVAALARIAAGPLYSGLDLDFENFASDPGHDAAIADRAAALYPAFAAQLAHALHGIGRVLIVTVMARTGPQQTYWRGRLATWVYDYAALGATADRIRVMAYDDSAPDTEPGPVAPLAWVQQIVAYAAQTMPPQKVELALPAYGYDWSGGSASTLSARDVAALAAAHAVTPRWDAQQAEYTFSYPGHTVWFEDTRADLVRARLAWAAGFAGIDIWAAGDESASLWQELRAAGAAG
jgi:spore germination protein YaaH